MSRHIQVCEVSRRTIPGPEHPIQKLHSQLPQNKRERSWVADGLLSTYQCLGFCVLFFFKDFFSLNRVLLCSLGWPDTHSAAEA